MRLHQLLCTAAAASATLVACKKNDDEGGTRGDENRVSFAYQRSCFFGCPLEQPLLAGTRERINVSDDGDVPGLQVESSDPERAEFGVERECHCERRGDSNARIAVAEDARCDSLWEKHCDNSVLVLARDAGEVELTLRDEHDLLIDRVTLLIAEPERARFQATLPDRLEAVEVTDVDLMPEQSTEVELTLYDEDGRELLAPEGVTWRVADAQVATVQAFLLGGGDEVSAGLNVVLKAVAEGETTLAVEVPGFDTELAIRVVP